MTRFTPVLAAVLLTCILIGTALAGGTPMTAKGDRQMVFLFSGLSRMTLSPYFHADGFAAECFDGEGENCYEDCYPCGGGLGFRYFLNDDRAIRFGVNIAVGSWEEKDVWEQTCMEFGFSLIYEKYLPHIHSIAPYIGAGIGFTHAKVDYTEPAVDTSLEWKEEASGNAFHMMGVLGFQWYFTDGMSLGGEYRPGFHYESGEETFTYDGEETGKNEFSGYALNHRAASVFLGVHF